VEWVETTGKTVADATEAAVEQLGVAEEDAEIEILDEPKSGLFGRMRTEARVRARVRPQSARPKDTRRRKRADEPAEAVASAAAGPAEDATPRRSPGRAASSRTARPVSPAAPAPGAPLSSAGRTPSADGDVRVAGPKTRGIVGSSDPAVAAAVLTEVRRLIEVPGRY
jgi:Jag N-terminus